MIRRKVSILVILLLTPWIALAQTFQWAKAIGGTGEQHTTSITTDNSNSVVVTGWFENNVDFDPDAGISLQSSAGYRDAFIAKYDQNGNHIWSYGIGGPFTDLGSSVITDSNNNIYLTGTFSSATIDFDPGPSTFFLTATNSTMFVIKYDSSGNFIWAGNSAIGVLYSSNSIKVDNIGNLYIVGSFFGTVDFDPGLGFLNITSNGYEDAFILKLDSAGSLIWVKTIGGLYDDEALKISFDINNNIIIAGTFKGTVDLDPGIGLFNQSALGNRDCFILKLNSNGEFIWAKCIQGDGLEDPRDLMLNTQGDIVIAGIFTNIVDFDPGISVYSDTSANLNLDFFILNLDSFGNFNWVYTNGDTLGDICASIQMDANNNIYALGGFTGTVDFDKGQGVYNLTSTDSADVYILKLNESGEFRWVKRFGGVFMDVGLANAKDNNGNIYSTGYFSGTVAFNPPLGANILGNTIDFFITKHNMCVNSTSFVNINACDSYISPSGNHIWFTSGNYQDTIPNFDGCDSILNINLNITSTSIIAISPSGAITFCQGDSVILTGTTGLATYQWYNRNYAIPGATSVNYTAKNSGRYKCIAQNSALCSDTSNIIIVNVPCIPIGPNHDRTILNSEFELPAFQVFPNPGSGLFTVESASGQLQVFNSLGSLILSVELFDGLNTFDISKFSDGIYFVTIKAGESVHSQKIIMRR